MYVMCMKSGCNGNQCNCIRENIRRVIFLVNLKTEKWKLSLHHLFIGSIVRNRRFLRLGMKSADMFFLNADDTIKALSHILHGYGLSPE